jgi:hypothetical protein
MVIRYNRQTQELYEQKLPPHNMYDVLLVPKSKTCFLLLASLHPFHQSLLLRQLVVEPCSATVRLIPIPHSAIVKRCSYNKAGLHQIVFGLKDVER